MAKKQQTDIWDQNEPVRIDKWLWAARFYKTRGLALDAIKQGQVTCNKVKPKPSRVLRAGDILQIQKGEQRFEITVLGLASKRGSATVAQSLYEESVASVQAREEAASRRKAERLSAPLPPSGRPDKHARQRIRRLLGK